MDVDEPTPARQSAQGRPDLMTARPRQDDLPAAAETRPEADSPVGPAFDPALRARRLSDLDLGLWFG